MRPIKGRLCAAEEQILETIEGGIENRAGRDLPYGGYLVVPRDRLGAVVGRNPLRLDLDDGLRLRIYADPAAASESEVVVVAFRGLPPD